MSGHVALLMLFITANSVTIVEECLPHLPWIHQANACNMILATLLPNIVNASRLVQHHHVYKVYRTVFSTAVSNPIAS